METGNIALPEANSAAAAAELSPVERLCEQGYQQLMKVAGAQTSAQAVELCNLALASFRQASELAGDDSEARRAARLGTVAAYSQLGHQYRYTANHAAAVKALSEAISLNSAQADDYFYRAQSYLKLGDVPAARQDFIEYLRRGEDEYLKQVAREQNAALVLNSDDGKAQAKHWQEEGIRLNAEAANFMQPRGEAKPDPARAVATYNKALDELAKALKVNPKEMMSQIATITALSEQASCYLEMEEYDLAIDNYSRIYAIRPLAQYVFKRGEVYRTAGHREQARADFELYLKQGNDRALKLQAQKYLEEKSRSEV